MRAICGKHSRRVLLLLLALQVFGVVNFSFCLYTPCCSTCTASIQADQEQVQVPNWVLPTESLHQSKLTTAYQGSGGHQAALRSSYLPESQLWGQASNTARGLLQSEQQGQSQQDAGSTTQSAAAAQTTSAASAAVQSSVTAGAASAEAKSKNNSTSILPAGIQQYQPGNMPLVNTDKLVSAAVAQASHLMADTIAVHEGENQFDTWQLVNPPFQEALHEVSNTSYIHQQPWHHCSSIFTKAICCSALAAANYTGFVSITTYCCGTAPYIIQQQVSACANAGTLLLLELVELYQQQGVQLDSQQQLIFHLCRNSMVVFL